MSKRQYLEDIGGGGILRKRQLRPAVGRHARMSAAAGFPFAAPVAPVPMALVPALPRTGSRQSNLWTPTADTSLSSVATCIVQAAANATTYTIIQLPCVVMQNGTANVCELMYAQILWSAWETLDVATKEQRYQILSLYIDSVSNVEQDLEHEDNIFNLYKQIMYDTTGTTYAIESKAHERVELSDLSGNGRIVTAPKLKLMYMTDHFTGAVSARVKLYFKQKIIPTTAYADFKQHQRATND